MEKPVQARIDTVANTVTDVYFWQNGQRSWSLYLYGPEEEYFIGENPIPESISAWVRLMIQRIETEKNKSGWEVVYKTNVVDNDLQAALERVKRKIETAIKKGVQRRIDLEEDLDLSDWETAMPLAES
jgi:hypothetical protein